MVCRLMFCSIRELPDRSCLLCFTKKFWDAPGTLDSPLEVDIFDDCIVSATKVYRDSVLNVLGERFHVDLVLIPL